MNLNKIECIFRRMQLFISFSIQMDSIPRQRQTNTMTETRQQNWIDFVSRKWKLLLLHRMMNGEKVEKVPSLRGDLPSITVSVRRSFIHSVEIQACD